MARRGGFEVLLDTLAAICDAGEERGISQTRLIMRVNCPWQYLRLNIKKLEELGLAEVKTNGKAVNYFPLLPAFALVAKYREIKSIFHQEGQF